MPLKPCLDCGTLSTGTRCTPCGTAHERPRYAARPSREARGYGWEHRRQTAQQIHDYPQCAHCGHGGSEDNPLTGEHGIPLAHGGTKVTGTLCRSCNSSLGATIRKSGDFF